jgi:tRNA A-37 threonylcarbamoyl transferase component Bud32
MSHADYSGKTLEGRYQVVRLLGSGGMGAVYEGRHVVVGKRVAIKFLHAEFAQNEEVLKRFYREAQAAAAIGHKSIVDIMDVGVSPDNEPYLVMEYLEGEDLDSMLQRTGALSVEAACGILEPALLALEAAHTKGIVHRDLKPANIFLVRNEGSAPTVKLIDFGISKFTGGNKESRLTRTGSLLGTPAYMAPEQARGVGDVDHRADVYSMGVILYHMLTGALPFDGENYNALLINVLTTEARRPRELNPSIPADAEAVILKQLRKSPAERSQSAREMLEELKDLSAYAERASGMSLLGNKIRRKVAGGDLGSVAAPPGSGSSASRVLSELAAKGTPGAWAGTAAGKGPPKALVIALGAAALAVAGMVVFVLTRGEPTQPVVATPGALIAATAAEAGTPSIDEGVLVSVEGAPKGATIIFNGTPVPMNPFRVARAKTIFPLRVESAGYEPFATSIVPSVDVKVTAAMKPLAASGVVKKSGGSHSSTSTSKKGAGTSTPEPPKPVAVAPTPPAVLPSAPTPPPKADKDESAGKKITKGKKGTMASSDFE